MREKPLVLITDDDPDIRGMVKIKLEANGFEVEEAKNGVEGCDLAKKLKPDIILMDIVMPEMDGVEALFELKKDKETKMIKIFLFTGKGDPRTDIVEVNRRFAMESGAVDFIRKEIDLGELVSKLKKTIQDMREDEEYKNRKEN